MVTIRKLKPRLEVVVYSLLKSTPCSTNNKNPEAGIGVQPKKQKSKAAKPLEKTYLYQGWVKAN